MSDQDDWAQADLEAMERKLRKRIAQNEAIIETAKRQLSQAIEQLEKIGREKERLALSALRQQI